MGNRFGISGEYTVNEKRKQVNFSKSISYGIAYKELLDSIYFIYEIRKTMYFFKTQSVLFQRDSEYIILTTLREYCAIICSVLTF